MGEPHEVKATLGCGTLIVIAIIVAVFGGNRDHDDLERKLDQLRREVEALRLELKARPPAPAAAPQAPLERGGE